MRKSPAAISPRDDRLFSLPQNRVRSSVPVIANLERFIFEKVIGEGKFSDVVRAGDNDTGKVVAVKVIGKNKIDEEKTLRKLDTEVKLQASCRHPNIL